ncbi:MAG: carboxymuconolactone decarboxylase family protein [Planctomycetaceae bacterium]|nr:carboxymuconolactone decarboxylase family protein [Planctomycetaceae bacterium]
MRYILALALTAVGAAGMARAAEPTSAPRQIPLTRPEMKQYLEDMKQRTPRIPLPELTDAEKEQLGDRSRSYESRLRTHYLPGGNDRFSFNGGGGSRGQLAPRADNVVSRSETTTSGSRSGGRENEPGMTLDYRFKVSLFWIVSRTNNCQYCLGHQESKLLSAGMKEDEIAALDSDWAKFNAAEQAAFAFARKFTLEPNKLEGADIAGLKQHYTDLQILEMILSMAGNNSINRWKEGVGVPQSEGGGGFGRRSETVAADTPPKTHSYLTPTSQQYQTALTLVAPVFHDAAGKATRQTVFARPQLEPRPDVQRALDQARQRTPRLPLVDQARAREVLGDDVPNGPLPQWMRLVANFPQSGRRLVSSTLFADEKGDLSPLLKAQVSWIIARQDRAWYALCQAQARLKALGQTDDQIFALDGPWDEFSAKDRALFTVARNLAASPVVLTDDEVAAAVKLAGPRDVVQMISYTTNRASFDRITEAAGLAIEP